MKQSSSAPEQIRRRPDPDAGFEDEIFAAMKGTPAMAAYDRAINALAAHVQPDEVGWGLFSDYESAVIARLEMAIRLSQREPVLPSTFGGAESTAVEEEFDRCWKLIRAMLGVDHLQEANDLHNAASARVIEAYDAGMLRGVGKLANPRSTSEINPDELLGELAQATTAIAQHLQDLAGRL